MGCREEFGKTLEEKVKESDLEIMRKHPLLDIQAMFFYNGWDAGRRSLELVIREAVEAMRAIRDADRNKPLSPSVYANLDNARIKLQSAIEEENK